MTTSPVTLVKDARTLTLAGGLAVAFDTAPGAAVAPEAIVFAALLASIFAPLLDHAAVLVIARIRRRRHG